MAGLLWNAFGLVWKAITAPGGGGLVLEPCPQCCDSDKAWVKACSCVTWVPDGSCGPVDSFVCKYVCLAAKLSDDTSRTIAERFDAIETILAGGGSVVVKDSDGYCYNLTTEVVTTIPAGFDEIGSAGATVTRASSCTDGCTDRGNGPLYIRLLPCPGATDPGFAIYICRSTVNVAKTLNLSGVPIPGGGGASIGGCFCADPSDQRDTIPGGAALANGGPSNERESCCTCRTTGAAACASGFVTKRNPTGTGTTRLQRCCCGVASGVRAVFGTAVGYRQWAGAGPSGPGGFRRADDTWSFAYRCTSSGNPQADGPCALVTGVSVQVYDNGDGTTRTVTTDLSPVILCPPCGSLIERNGAGGWYPIFGSGFSGGLATGDASCSGASATWVGTDPNYDAAGSWSVSVTFGAACPNCGG